MRIWQIKAFIQGILSFLPQSSYWNYLFQQYVTKGLALSDSDFEQKLSICSQHLTHYHNHSQTLPEHVLEIGTGWLPVIPIGLYLSGVPVITSVDINPLLSAPLARRTLQKFMAYANEDRLALHLPHLKPERLKQIAYLLEESKSLSVEELLQNLDITVLRADARRMEGIKPDFIISNNTFEHIEPKILAGILQHFHRIIHPNGLMSHQIDLSDHYSHFDHRITPYNFLRYDNWTWRIFNNHLHYQNRLRVSDYRRLHLEAKFQIISEDNQPTSTSEQLKSISLAAPFQHYTDEELIVTLSWMVSIPTN